MKVTWLRQCYLHFVLLISAPLCYAESSLSDEIMQKAIKGDIESQVYLGKHFFQQGDYEQSYKWYERAAEQNDLESIYQVGLAYERGLGKKQDYNQAIKWYQNAAEQNYMKAQFQLGTLYCPSENHFKEKNKTFPNKTNSAPSQESSSLGAQLLNEGVALFDKGKDFLQYKGNEFFAEDCKIATQWYTKAAEQGMLEAQYNLAYLYHTKEGLINYPNAIHWYQKAAEQNFSLAKYQIGLMYYKGQGMLKDNEQAVSWLYKASQENVPEAKHLLGKILIDVDRRSDGLKFLHSAAEDNLAAAQYDLAALYLQEADTWKTGFDWLKKAEEQGYGEAEFMLAYIYLNGKWGIPQDIQKATYYAGLACSKGIYTDTSCKILKEGTLATGEQLYKGAKEVFNWFTK